MKQVRHNGTKMYRAKSLGYRMSDVEKDLDAKGSPMKFNEIVFVKIDDCQISKDEEGTEHYCPDKAPQAFKLAMGGTYYGYHTVVRTARKPIVIEDANGIHFIENGQQYRDVRKLMVQNGWVYSTSYKAIMKEE